MPQYRVYDITCKDCGNEMRVGEEYWPATRYEPADGSLDTEECDKCGREVTWDDLEGNEAEPDEPEYEPDPYDWEWE